MLNKRIKSLLVAGIVMLGITGNVFANDIHENTKFSTTTVPQIVVGGFEAEFQGGTLLLDIEVDDSSESQKVWKTQVIYNKDWYLPQQLDITFDNGHVQSIDLTHVSAVVTDSEIYDGYKVITYNFAYEPDAEITDAGVYFNLVLDENNNGILDFKDDEPVDPNPGEPDPEPEEPEINDPETGDVGIAGLLLAATGIGAGLVVVNKGKDNEEE